MVGFFFFFKQIPTFCLMLTLLTLYIQIRAGVTTSKHWLTDVEDLFVQIVVESKVYQYKERKFYVEAMYM